jgi:hypothetical protein
MAAGKTRNHQSVVYDFPTMACTADTRADTGTVSRYFPVFNCAEEYVGGMFGGIDCAKSYCDQGGGSRLFAVFPVEADPGFRYVGKTTRSEREAGCDHLPKRTAGDSTGGRKEGSEGLDNPRAGASRGEGAHNFHPTVKPEKLMRWLVRLVSFPGATVLDPFMGSGSTGVACVGEDLDFIGFEQDAAYMDIACARIDHAEAVLAESLVGRMPDPWKMLEDEQ